MKHPQKSNTQQKYTINNNCEKALIDFPFHDEISTWLEEYNPLFESIKIEACELDSPSFENTHYSTNNFITQFYFKFKELSAEND